MTEQSINSKDELIKAKQESDEEFNRKMTLYRKRMSKLRKKHKKKQKEFDDFYNQIGKNRLVKLNKALDSQNNWLDMDEQNFDQTIKKLQRVLHIFFRMDSVEKENRGKDLFTMSNDDFENDFLIQLGNYLRELSA